MFRETEILKPLYTARIENGAVLFVYDGYAEGSDGNIYKPVFETFDDGDCEVVGWEVSGKIE